MRHNITAYAPGAGIMQVIPNHELFRKDMNYCKHSNSYFREMFSLPENPFSDGNYPGNPLTWPEPPERSFRRKPPVHSVAWRQSLLCLFAIIWVFCLSNRKNSDRKKAQYFHKPLTYHELKPTETQGLKRILNAEYEIGSLYLLLS